MPPRPRGWLARADNAFRAHEDECAARLAATEQDIERLRQNLEQTMGSLAKAFQGLPDVEAGSRGAAAGSRHGEVDRTRLDAAIVAIQFQDIGSQWLAHIASHLRLTRSLVEELRMPFDVVKMVAIGDWHGFERGTGAWDEMGESLAVLRANQPRHPVGHALKGCGDVEIF
ncbi:MAG: hypothetical protein EXR28_17655 [Betaproteobacteria bacterium]|nr:hypothetical protein [Betaproteobacteria bacterium]